MTAILKTSEFDWILECLLLILLCMAGLQLHTARVITTRKLCYRKDDRVMRAI